VNEVTVVSVDDCPRSRAVGLTEIACDERAAFTVTVTKPDVTMAGELELSVTWTSKDQDPIVVKTPEDVDTGEVHVEEFPRLA
jgi:hypothetical protein